MNYENNNSHESNNLLKEKIIDENINEGSIKEKLKVIENNYNNINEKNHIDKTDEIIKEYNKSTENFIEKDEKKVEKIIEKADQEKNKDKEKIEKSNKKKIYENQKKEYKDRNILIKFKKKNYDKKRNNNKRLTKKIKRVIWKIMRKKKNLTNIKIKNMKENKLKKILKNEMIMIILKKFYKKKRKNVKENLIQKEINKNKEIITSLDQRKIGEDNVYNNKKVKNEENNIKQIFSKKDEIKIDSIKSKNINEIEGKKARNKEIKNYNKLMEEKDYEKRNEKEGNNIIKTNENCEQKKENNNNIEGILSINENSNKKEKKINIDFNIDNKINIINEIKEQIDINNEKGQNIENKEIIEHFSENKEININNNKNEGNNDNIYSKNNNEISANGYDGQQNNEDLKNKNHKNYLEKDKVEKKDKIYINSIENQVSISFIGEKKKFSENILSVSNFHTNIITNKKIMKIKRNENFSLLYKDEDINSFLSNVNPKGLKNLGSCCYMNATLQCFYHIKEFTSYFLNKKKEIKRKNGLLTNGLLDLIEGLSKKNNLPYYIPKTFKDNLEEVDELFDGYGGKDSGDLVETILTKSQEELAGEPDFPDFTIDQRNEKLMYLDLCNQNLKVRSIIIDLFYFYTRDTCTCLECGIKFYNISCENMLTFGLEGIYNFCNKKEDNNLDSFNYYHSSRKLSVDDCLNSFSLNGAIRDNRICKYCNKKTSILSVKGFITLPEIFIMLMNRGQNEKFECEVEFKEQLDLEDFYIGDKKKKKERTTKYNLLAGTILYGSGGYGHTVAFCKHFDGNYYIFNDSTVSKTSYEKIKNEKIYLLFYKKL